MDGERKVVIKAGEHLVGGGGQEKRKANERRQNGLQEYGCDTMESRSRWPRGLRPLDCWNCGFESRREGGRHECLSVV